MTTTAINEPTISASPVSTKGLSKSFGGIEVLRNVDMEVAAGEIHALLGENGAGKSTFAKILAGVHRASSGEIFIAGKRAAANNPLEAQELGVTLIHQEPLSFPDLSVAENLVIGRQQQWFKRVRWRAIEVEARRLLLDLDANIDPKTKMRGLSVADQQLVEIARALAIDCRLLIMDEPTAALTPQETATLFGIMRRLKGEGRSIIFISHRLEEVREICDRVTIFRDGEKVLTSKTADLSDDDIIRHMIGRPLKDYFHKISAHTGEVVLEAKKLILAGKFKDISFNVRAGEIVGFGGLVGAGRTEVAAAIFGAEPATSGDIFLRGEKVSFRAPQDAIARGIGYVPEDRAIAGIFASMSIETNVTAAAPALISENGLLNREKETQLASESVRDLHVKFHDIKQPIAELSGGNQQKVILARWLLTRPQVLILDEPTRGVDIGAKTEIYDIIGRLAEQGCAVLLISSDLPELLALSDRILVMSEGILSREFSRSDATQDAIMTAAIPSATHADRRAAQ